MNPLIVYKVYLQKCGFEFSEKLGFHEQGGTGCAKNILLIIQESVKNQHASQEGSSLSAFYAFSSSVYYAPSFLRSFCFLIVF